MNQNHRCRTNYEKGSARRALSLLFVDCWILIADCCMVFLVSTPQRLGGSYTQALVSCLIASTISQEDKATTNANVRASAPSPRSTYKPSALHIHHPVHRSYNISESLGVGGCIWREPASS